MDQGEALLRIKAAIDSTLKTVEIGPMSGGALAQSYDSYRSEVLIVLSEGETFEEFQRLFAAMAPGTMPHSAAGFDPRKSAGLANQAAAGLAGISGWIDGRQRSYQARAEAQAYADARLRRENQQ
ncbi:MAG TPA: hypothetical protein VK925_07710 [Jiangellaceae bacterium]|nr:hypothetical protein [Jiangellaceae bacterium]